jgi:hypothetical protein
MHSHHTQPSEPLFFLKLMDSPKTKSNDNFENIWTPYSPYTSMWRYPNIVNSRFGVWIRECHRVYISVENPNNFLITHICHIKLKFYQFRMFIHILHNDSSFVFQIMHMLVRLSPSCHVHAICRPYIFHMF